MDFQQILCFLFSRLQKEKTANAAYYILQGKRSGQSLQDARNYGLEAYFSILPKLTLAQFDHEVADLQAQQYITIDAEKIVHLTEKGMLVVQKMRPHHFNGWFYRGNERIFFQRLSLIIQTVSYLRVDEKQFLPIQQDPQIQQFVKGFLRTKPYTRQSFADQLKAELHTLLKAQQGNDLGKEVFVYRLTGYRHTGKTWIQIARQLEMAPLDVQCAFIETAHWLLDQLEQEEHMPLLQEIAFELKLAITLTASTKQTKQLFDIGKSLEEIAMIRQLKMSTIEDHIIELAMNDPQFPIGRFVALEDCHIVKKFIAETQIKKLRLLKDRFSKLTYFQLRLILSTPRG